MRSSFTFYTFPPYYIVANSPVFCGRLPHFELASRRFPHYDKSPTFLPHTKLIAQMIKLSEKSTIRCNPQLENQENACVRSSKPLSYFGLDVLILLKQGHVFDHYANFRPNFRPQRAPPNPQLINSSADANEDVRSADMLTP